MKRLYGGDDLAKEEGWTEVVWIRINSGYGAMQVDLNNRTVCQNI